MEGAGAPLPPVPREEGSRRPRTGDLAGAGTGLEAQGGGAHRHRVGAGRGPGAAEHLAGGGGASRGSTVAPGEAGPADPKPPLLCVPRSEADPARRPPPDQRGHAPQAPTGNCPVCSFPSFLFSFPLPFSPLLFPFWNQAHGF